MEQYTCQDYIDAFVANQTDIDDFRVDYPDGLSVADIVANDTIPVYGYTYANGRLVERIEAELPGVTARDVILDSTSLVPVHLADGRENYNTRYAI